MSRIVEATGDIFSAPPNSVLLHACNCRGVWGSGVALEFKKRFPSAYRAYNEYCNTPPGAFDQRSLLGTALLIPSREDEGDYSNDHAYWIACLFTSIGYGRTVSSPDVILDNTKKAMADLHQKVTFLRNAGQNLGEIWAVRINSGRFGVEWERTKKILEQCAMDLRVVRPAKEEIAQTQPDTKVTPKRKRPIEGTKDKLGQRTKDAARFKVTGKRTRKGAKARESRAIDLKE